MVNLVQLGDFVSDIGLAIALIMFVYLLIKSRIEGRWFKSFKFWISIVVVFWVIPEAIALRGPFPLILQAGPVAPTGVSLEVLEGSIGPWFHTLSMGALALLIVWKLRVLLGLPRARKGRK